MKTFLALIILVAPAHAYAQDKIEWFAMGGHISEPGVKTNDIEHNILATGVTWTPIKKVEIDFLVGKRKNGCSLQRRRYLR